MIALIRRAGSSIARNVVRTPAALVIAALAAAAGIARLNSIWVLLATGARVCYFSVATTLSAALRRSFHLCLSLPSRRSLPALGSLFGVAVTFLKIGFVSFGGGFVIVPVLHHHLVTEPHWLNRREPHAWNICSGASLLHGARRDPPERDRRQNAARNRQVGGDGQVRPGNTGHIRRLVREQSTGGPAQHTGLVDSLDLLGNVDLGGALLCWLLKRWRSKTPSPSPPSNFEDRALPDIEDEDSP